LNKYRSKIEKEIMKR